MSLMRTSGTSGSCKQRNLIPFYITYMKTKICSITMGLKNGHAMCRIHAIKKECTCTHWARLKKNRQESADKVRLSEDTETKLRSE